MSRHSWHRRLLAMLVMVPSVIAGGNVLLAAPAHAAAACDPLEMSASISVGTEIVSFKLQNCTATSQRVILSGIRHAPAACVSSGLNFGDSPPFRIRAYGTITVTHQAPAPTCKGMFTVTGDSEVRPTAGGEGAVLDQDKTSYTT